MKGFGFLLLVVLSSMSQAMVGQDLRLNSASFKFDANSFIDSLLQKYSNDILRSVKIGNIHRKYAYDCRLNIAKGIHRIGNTTFEVKDRKIFFDFGLSTERITVKCRWYKKNSFFVFVRIRPLYTQCGLLPWRFLKIHVNSRGTVKARTDGVNIYSKFAMNLYENPKAQLLDFKVTELQPIKTSGTGLWVANLIAEKYLNKSVNGARDKIITELEQNTSETFQAVLDNLKLPFSLYALDKNIEDM